MNALGPPVGFLTSAAELLAMLDGVQVSPMNLAVGSQAAKENAVGVQSGIDPEFDMVSASGVCLQLDSRLRAAREHLLSCLTLMTFAGERTPANSVDTLSRSALEGSAICLWLCSNQITWEERLKRFSQLHLRMTRDCLKDSGINPHECPNSGELEPGPLAILNECNSHVEWVQERGWVCNKGKQKGKIPTLSSWINELPSYSDTIKEAAHLVGLDPEEIKSLYGIASKAAHTDPITVADDSSEAHENIRIRRSQDSISLALLFYSLAKGALANWCDVPSPGEEVLHRVFALREHLMD